MVGSADPWEDDGDGENDSEDLMQVDEVPNGQAPAPAQSEAVAGGPCGCGSDVLCWRLRTAADGEAATAADGEAATDHRRLPLLQAREKGCLDQEALARIAQYTIIRTSYVE